MTPDIKAIREAAEAVRLKAWGMDYVKGANPATVLALCDEVERLTKANDNLFDQGQKMFHECEHQAGLIKALEAQVANQQKHLLRQDAELDRLRAKPDNPDDYVMQY